MPASGTEGDYSGPATIRVTAHNTSIFQDWTVNVTEALNDSTDILTFSIPQETGPATINENNHTVNVEVAYGTDRTQITPVFTLLPVQPLCQLVVLKAIIVDQLLLE